MGRSRLTFVIHDLHHARSVRERGWPRSVRDRRAFATAGADARHPGPGPTMKKAKALPSHHRSANDDRVIQKPKPPPASPKGARHPAPADPAGSARARLTGPLIAAFFLALLIVQVPSQVWNIDLDPSWAAVLDYARQKRLQFGVDLVFTYGPLGFLITEWFGGQGPLLRMVFAWLLAWVIAAGVCLTAWRTALAWRILFLGVFALLPAMIRPGMIDLPVQCGLLCWALLCFVESGPRARYFTAILLVFAVFISLMKFTFLLQAWMTIITLAATFALRGRARAACGLVLGYVAGWFCLWVLLGQSPLHIGAYFRSSFEMSTGYESAMGLPFEDSVVTAGVLSALLAFAVVFIHCLAGGQPAAARSRWPRLLVAAWAAGFLFLAWKHGFLRAKSDLWAGFVAVAAMAFAAPPLPDGRRVLAWTARACAVACCLLALAIENWKEPGHFEDFATRETTLIVAHARALLNPFGYRREMNQKLEAQRAHAQLPNLSAAIGRSTVDVFGQNSAYALFNDLNYRPRPVFQSYAVFNAPLMEINDRAFAADAAPAFVLFNLPRHQRALPAAGRCPYASQSPGRLLTCGRRGSLPAAQARAAFRPPHDPPPREHPSGRGAHRCRRIWQRGSMDGGLPHAFRRGPVAAGALQTLGGLPLCLEPLHLGVALVSRPRPHAGLRVHRQSAPPAHPGRGRLLRRQTRPSPRRVCDPVARRHARYVAGAHPLPPLPN